MRGEWFTTNISHFFIISKKQMKYLIVGLGNIGAEYKNTRHNIGFMIVDNLVKEYGGMFQDKRYAAVSTIRIKNAELIVIKPSTYMNLSGQAVRYWMQQENIPIERNLIIVDDLAIPYGKIRIKGKGSDAGHNGLKNIANLLGSQSYPRLRFGIGNDFSKGQQIDFVLGTFTKNEQEHIQEHIDRACQAIKSFCLEGISITMNRFNQ